MKMIVLSSFVGYESMSVFRDLYREFVAFMGRVGICLTDREVILCQFHPAGMVVDIACVDRVTEVERWRQKLWCLNGPVAVAGRDAEHYLEMKISNDHIFVFGASVNGAYVEGFSLESGRPWLRFSSNNWTVDRGAKP